MKETEFKADLLVERPIKLDLLVERPIKLDDEPYIIIPADRSYVQILDYKIEDYGDLESFVEDLRAWKKYKEDKDYYNNQIDELYNIIESRDRTINDLESENRRVVNAINELREYMLDVDHKMGWQYANKLDELLGIDVIED